MLFLVTCAAIALFVLPFIVAQFQFAADRTIYNDDMRIMYPYFRFHDPELFRNDYIGGYFQSRWQPAAYLTLLWLWSQFADPEPVFRYLPPLLWLLMAWPVGMAAARLGGRLNAWAAVLIYLCSSVFLFRMTGGLAHMFGFPLILWGVVALLRGSAHGLALATMASAALYPAMTPILGLSLAIYLLFPGKRLERSAGQRWPLVRKLMFLGAVASVSALLTVPMLVSGGDYGRGIVPLKEAAQFPEASVEGRLSVAVVRSPFNYLATMIFANYSTRFGYYGMSVLALLTAGLIAMWIVLRDARDPRPTRLSPFIYAWALCTYAAVFFMYATTHRFLVHVIPLLLLLFFPLALGTVVDRLFPAGRVRHSAFVLCVLAYAFSHAKADPEAAGFLYTLAPETRPALDFVAALPKDALLAGWPGEINGKVAENVPFFARRKVLVLYEGHAPAHEKYVLTLRERMYALVDAYLAVDLAPLLVLRDAFGVDYLIVNAEDYGKSPRYFAPFDTRAEERWNANREKGFMALKLAKTKAVVFSDGPIYILDLHVL